MKPVLPLVAHRVVLADASSVYLNGLRLALEKCCCLVVAGEVATGADAVERCRDAGVGALVTDIDLPDRSGIDVCRAVLAQRPQLPVVLLSYWDWDVYLAVAYAAGASGFVLKRSSPEILAEVISAALSRGRFSVQQLQRIYRWESAVRAPLRGLACRERDVLWGVADGKSNREIAIDLTLSESTVEKYVSTILRKLNLPSRAGLQAYILQNQLSAVNRRFLEVIEPCPDGMPTA
jgi:DNA-binding NarL/FixJ family response regulator